MYNQPSYCFTNQEFAFDFVENLDSLSSPTSTWESLQFSNADSCPVTVGSHSCKEPADMETYHSTDDSEIGENSSHSRHPDSTSGRQKERMPTRKNGVLHSDPPTTTVRNLAQRRPSYLLWRDRLRVNELALKKVTECSSDKVEQEVSAEQKVDTFGKTLSWLRTELVSILQFLYW